MVAAGPAWTCWTRLGTDVSIIARAIEVAGPNDGVLASMDLSSAVLSAEMAAEMMLDERGVQAAAVRGPLVEGAAAAPGRGPPRRSAGKERRRREEGSAGKVAHLGRPGQPGLAPSLMAGPALELRMTVTPRLGLHARPAARSCRPWASSTPR